MYVIVWKYTVRPEEEEQFIHYYKSDGVWAKLFEKDQNYIGTDLLRGEEAQVYLTIDTWISKEAYEEFGKTNREQYLEIDKICEDFTESEVFLGSFTHWS